MVRALDCDWRRIGSVICALCILMFRLYDRFPETTIPPQPPSLPMNRGQRCVVLSGTLPMNRGQRCVALSGTLPMNRGQRCVVLSGTLPMNRGQRCVVLSGTLPMNGGTKVCGIIRYTAYEQGTKVCGIIRYTAYEQGTKVCGIIRYTAYEQGNFCVKWHVNPMTMHHRLVGNFPCQVTCHSNVWLLAECMKRCSDNSTWLVFWVKMQQLCNSQG